MGIEQGCSYGVPKDTWTNDVRQKDNDKIMDKIDKTIENIEPSPES